MFEETVYKLSMPLGILRNPRWQKFTWKEFFLDWKGNSRNLSTWLFTSLATEKNCKTCLIWKVGLSWLEKFFSNKSCYFSAWQKKKKEEDFFPLFILDTQCENYGNLLSRFFDKIFVIATFWVKTLLKCWFHEIFSQWE